MYRLYFKTSPKNGGELQGKLNIYETKMSKPTQLVGHWIINILP